jgi:hypothetical protein
VAEFFDLGSRPDARGGIHPTMDDPEYEEMLRVLLDLQTAADTLSALTRQALVRLSSLAVPPGRHELLIDDEGSVP